MVENFRRKVCVTVVLFNVLFFSNCSGSEDEIPHSYESYKNEMYSMGYYEVPFDPTFHIKEIYLLVHGDLYENSGIITHFFDTDKYDITLVRVIGESESPNLFAYSNFKHNGKLYTFLKINYMQEWIDVIEYDSYDQNGVFLGRVVEKVFY